MTVEDAEAKARAEKNEVWGRVAFGIGAITSVLMLMGCLFSLGGLPNPCCFLGCLGAPAAFVAAGVGFNTESRSEAVIGIILGAVTGLTSIGFFVAIIAALVGLGGLDGVFEVLDF